MAIGLLFGVLRGTPLWMWPLLAFVVWRGLRAARPRVGTLRSVWIVPGFFMAWGLLGLATRPQHSGLVFAIWLCGAAGAAVLGRLLGPRELAVDRRHGLVGRPGSWWPLGRNLVIFGAHYGLAVAAALRPDRRESLALWDIVVSGASFGYFVGWTARFIRSYRDAPEVTLHDARPAWADRAKAIGSNAA